MNKEKSTAFMLKVASDLAAGLAVQLVPVGDRAGLFKAMAGAGAPGALRRMRQAQAFHALRA